MNNKNKFYIKNLDINKKYYKCSYIVLENKLKIVLKLVKKYLKEESIENLHQLRIAVRKLRYVMEIFSGCYNKKEFIKAYKKVKFLQDELGKGRDYDVLIEKLKSLNEINFNTIKEKFEIEKENIRQTIKKELIKFVEEKNEFNFLINKK
ncbi:MAG: CHAD domain-containing protein [Melioribacteraceae bacterium]|nr:CHAD domain-containing protein [Melioribacteraceae bacterium]